MKRIILFIIAALAYSTAGWFGIYIDNSAAEIAVGQLNGGDEYLQSMMTLSIYERVQSIAYYSTAFFLGWFGITFLKTKTNKQQHNETETN